MKGLGVVRVNMTPTRNGRTLPSDAGGRKAQGPRFQGCQLKGLIPFSKYSSICDDF